MSEIKQINTGVAELLAVKVPEGASDFCVPNDIYLSSLPILQWWISKNGIVDGVGSTTLPPGNWAPLVLSDQLTEERCAELLPYSCNSSMLPYTLIFASLMQANGINDPHLILKRLS